MRAVFPVKSSALYTVAMNASRTARERARAELTREIKEAARRQLADQGAQRLSLRAVARELGMVSSALYRYFPSRDDLLTALIIDAYDAVGEAVESGSAGEGDPRERWRALCRALREWAIAHPHEYALVYGSPVPGYQAPRATVESAARVPLAMLSVVRDAVRDTAPDARGQAEELPAGLAEQVERVARDIGMDIPAPVMARALTAWTQLFGMISFELFGHLVGSADPADSFFAFAVERTADLIGLPPVRTLR